MACGLNKLPWDGGSSPMFFPDDFFLAGNLMTAQGNFNSFTNPSSNAKNVEHHYFPKSASYSSRSFCVSSYFDKLQYI
jgi:hypothetical protein